METQPIGIFDSGLGGISVWKELVKLLPNERTIYYADSANCPYGSRSIEKITELSERIVQFLLAQKCKIIVIACNTITAASIDFLKAKYNTIQFIGIKPAIQLAAKQTKTGSIGVLATKSTLASQSYKNSKRKYAKNLQVSDQVGDGLVEIVEGNQIDTVASHELIEKYIKSMIDLNVDQIVLGCTHYPFLLPIIQSITGNRVNIINAAPAVARQTSHVLEQEQLLNKSETIGLHHFYTSGDKRILADFLAVHIEEKVFIHQD